MKSADPRRNIRKIFGYNSRTFGKYFSRFSKIIRIISRTLLKSSPKFFEIFLYNSPNFTKYFYFYDISIKIFVRVLKIFRINYQKFMKYFSKVSAIGNSRNFLKYLSRFYKILVVPANFVLPENVSLAND